EIVDAAEDAGKGEPLEDAERERRAADAAAREAECAGPALVDAAVQRLDPGIVVARCIADAGIDAVDGGVLGFQNLAPRGEGLAHGAEYISESVSIRAPRHGTHDPRPLSP